MTSHAIAVAILGWLAAGLYILAVNKGDFGAPGCLAVALALTVSLLFRS